MKIILFKMLAILMSGLLSGAAYADDLYTLSCEMSNGASVVVSGSSEAFGDAVSVSMEEMGEESLAMFTQYKGLPVEAKEGYLVTISNENGDAATLSSEVAVSATLSAEYDSVVFYTDDSSEDAEDGIETAESAFILLGIDFETELSSGEYTLTGDISGVSFVVPEGAEVIINLDGHSITGEEGESAFTVYGSLTVNGEGTVSGTADLGGAFYVSGEEAVLTLNNVIVTGGSAVTGGGIYLESGSAYLTNSYVYANTASSGAADIYVSENAAIYFEDCDFTAGEYPVDGCNADGYYDDNAADRWGVDDNYSLISEFEEGTEYYLMAAYSIYTVSYSANGGEGSVLDSNVYYYGDTVTVMDGNYTLDGYIFDSWNTLPQGGDDDVTYYPGDEIVITESIILYAQYRNSAVISFDANGAEGEMEDDSCIVGAKYETPECEFTYEGYLFVSWNTESDGSGDEYAAGDVITVSEDITLYAQWEEDPANDASDDEEDEEDEEDTSGNEENEEDEEDPSDDEEDEEDTSDDEEDEEDTLDDEEDEKDEEDTSGNEEDEEDEEDTSDDEEDASDDEDVTDEEDTEDTSDDEEDTEDTSDDEEEEEETFKIYIKAVDEDEIGLAGAEFVIMDPEGEEIISWTSSYYFKGIELPAGTYILTEEEAPAGYEPADDVTFKISASGAVSISSGDALLSQSPVQICIVHEYEAEKSVYIYKMGMGSNLLAGASLILYDEDGDTVKSWTTDGSGKELELVAGTYTLHESSAPDGYLVADDIEFEVEIDGTILIDDDEVSNVTMEDEWTLVALELFDGNTGVGITGAVLQVLDEDGTVVKEWTTDDDGVNRLSATLTAGETYVLHQVTATSGYAIADDISFTVSNTADEQYVIMKNYPVSCTVSADGTGSIQVVKTVTGTGADTTKSFGFLLTLLNADGTVYTGTIGYISSDGTSGTTQMTSAGQIGFELSHGQAITFYGIPEGTVYSVAELDYSSAGYTSSIASGSAVDVTDDGLIRIEFVNTYSASSVTSTGTTYYSSISSSGSGTVSAATGASVTGTVSGTYDTGDSSNMRLWIQLLGAGLILLVGIVLVLKKRSVKNTD